MTGHAYLYGDGGDGAATSLEEIDMSKSTKILGTTVALAGLTAIGAFAFAQGGPGHGHGRMGMGHGGMGGGHGAMMAGPQDNSAARLDAIKSDIGIRPDQTAAWETYAKVVSEIANGRRAHRESIDRDAVRRMEPAERQAHVEGMSKQREAEASKLRTAADTLLAQLDDSQKEKARRALPGIASADAGGGMRHGMMGGMGRMGGHDMGGGRGMGHGMGQRSNH